MLSLQPHRRCGRALRSLAVLVLSLVNNNCIVVDGFAPPTTATTALSTSTCNNPPLFVGKGIEDFDRELQQQEASSITNKIVEEDDALLEKNIPTTNQNNENNDVSSPFGRISGIDMIGNGPPLDIDDTNLVLYDVFLLMNLVVSISYLVVHRLNIQYVPSSLHEGALLSICWIIAGLGNGAFIYSAIDGHYDPRSMDENGEYEKKGGPRAAGLLAVSTFVTTSSLRIMMALVLAVLQHRRVGLVGSGEELIPLEIIFGLVLMSLWRTFHSVNTPRI